MNPEFPRISQAIKYTLEFYNIWKIKEYINWLSNPSKHYPVNDWADTVIYLHNKMEDEINQTIHTTNANTQNFLFESLKEWLEDYRIKPIEPEIFLKLIDEYNKKTYEDFELLIETAVEKFRQSPNFYREHLEEYEVESKTNTLLGGGYFPFRKSKEKNYKFYCITESPDLIDLAYFNEYLVIVNKVTGNFRRVISKYVKLYDAGKIFENSSSQISFGKLPNTYPPLLEESKEKKKLKVSLTVSQLAVLFKLLNDTKVIQNSSNTEICQFISSNFETKASYDISTKNLMNNFSNPDKISASHLSNLLKSMKSIADKI